MCDTKQFGVSGRAHTESDLLRVVRALERSGDIPEGFYDHLVMNMSQRQVCNLISNGQNKCNGDCVK